MNVPRMVFLVNFSCLLCDFHWWLCRLNFTAYFIRAKIILFKQYKIDINVNVSQKMQIITISYYYKL